jgi:hypothetical protein
VDVEDLSEEELKTLHRYYGRLAEMCKSDTTLTQSHSVEEAQAWHEAKVVRAGKAGAGPRGAPGA